MWDGRVSRGYLGIAGQNVKLDPALARRHGLPEPQGVLIQDLSRGGLAHVAGLLPGDIIVTLGEKPTGTIDHIHQILTAEGVGSELSIRFLREERVRESRVSPVDRPPGA